MLLDPRPQFAFPLVTPHPAFGHPLPAPARWLQPRAPDPRVTPRFSCPSQRSWPESLRSPRFHLAPFLRATARRRRPEAASTPLPPLSALRERGDPARGFARLAGGLRKPG